MSLNIEEVVGDKVLEVHINGKLTKAEYLQFVPTAEHLIQEHGKIRVLFEMTDFHGWEAGSLWEDVKFDAKHFTHIERVAMVGEKPWQKAMSVFCQPFTTAKIRYFDHSKIDEARAWVHEP